MEKQASSIVLAADKAGWIDLSPRHKIAEIRIKDRFGPPFPYELPSGVP